MWIVLGLMYTFIQPGVMQLHVTQEYDTVEECWIEAQKIMGDSVSPDHMACVPQFKPLSPQDQEIVDTKLEGILT